MHQEGSLPAGLKPGCEMNEQTAHQDRVNAMICSYSTAFRVKDS